MPLLGSATSQEAECIAMLDDRQDFELGPLANEIGERRVACLVGGDQLCLLWGVLRWFRKA